MVDVVQFRVILLSVTIPNVILLSVNILTVAVQVFLLRVTLPSVVLVKVTALCKHIIESQSQLCEEMSRTVVSLLNLK